MLAEDQRMSRKKPNYTAEYKAEAVRLARESGRAMSDVAQDIGVSLSALRKWIKQAEVDEMKGSHGSLTTDERAELLGLRRDNRQLKMERDLLKKSVAFFVRENG